MSFASSLERFATQLDALAETIGRWVSWLTLAMVLVTFTVVVLRYAFNLGWIALQESITYLHATVFLLGAAYTLRHDAHVRVDVFYRDFRPATKAWVDLLGALGLLLPVCGFILWSSWGYVAESWALHEGSREAGGLPGLYLLKTAIPVMAVLVMIQGIAQALHALTALLEHRPEPSGQPPAEL